VVKDCSDHDNKIEITPFENCSTRYYDWLFEWCNTYWNFNHPELINVIDKAKDPKWIEEVKKEKYKTFDPKADPLSLAFVYVRYVITPRIDDESFDYDKIVAAVFPDVKDRTAFTNFTKQLRLPGEHRVKIDELLDKVKIPLLLEDCKIDAPVVKLLKELIEIKKAFETTINPQLSAKFLGIMKELERQIVAGEVSLVDVFNNSKLSQEVKDQANKIFTAAKTDERLDAMKLMNLANYENVVSILHCIGLYVGNLMNIHNTLKNQNLMMDKVNDYSKKRFQLTLSEVVMAEKISEDEFDGYHKVALKEYRDWQAKKTEERQERVKKGLPEYSDDEYDDDDKSDQPAASSSSNGIKIEASAPAKTPETINIATPGSASSNGVKIESSAPAKTPETINVATPGSAFSSSSLNATSSH
jgi:hypothetical protein